MEEIWKPVEGFENFYEVSNTGRVRSLPRTIALKGKREGQFRTYEGKDLKLLNSQDHLLVHLSNSKGERLSICVGQLVAKHFLEGYKESGRKQVKYKDGDPSHVSIDNLE